MDVIQWVKRRRGGVVKSRRGKGRREKFGGVKIRKPYKFYGSVSRLFRGREGIKGDQWPWYSRAVQMCLKIKFLWYFYQFWSNMANGWFIVLSFYIYIIYAGKCSYLILTTYLIYCWCTGVFLILVAWLAGKFHRNEL